MIAALIVGDLTDDEIKRLLSLLRDIDTERPTAAINVRIMGAEGTSLASMERLLHESWPDQPDRETRIAVLPLPRRRGEYDA